MGKKGVELSLNFLVVVILSITMLGFGIYFISNLFSEADDLKKIYEEDFSAQLGNIACSDADKVCVPKDKMTIQRGKYGIFGVKVINILTDRAFKVQISHGPAFKKDGTQILGPDLINLITQPPSSEKTIRQNEEQQFALAVGVPKNAVAGTYILDLNVEKKVGDAWENYDAANPTIKLYVEVP